MKHPLRIVIFDGSFKTTAFIRRLIEGLAAHHDVYVFGFNEMLPQRIPNVTYVALGSASRSFRLVWISLVCAFKLLFYKGDFLGFINYLRYLVRFQKKRLQQQNLLSAVTLIKPDIVHVQWPSLLSWCEPLLDERSPKILLSQRGYQNNVRPFVDHRAMNYLKKVYPKIDGFHSVSQAMMQRSNQIYESPRKMDRVVYSGFDFSTLPYNTNYTRNKPLNLLSVGRPHWIKGYTYALKACKLLKEQGVDFKYTIIGAAKNEELQYLVQAYELELNVILSSRVPQEVVYNKMQSSDVLLFPSLKEGLPNVIVEAMVLGLPVIATDCGGVSELLDETTGMIVPTRDPQAMAAAVKRFAETPLDKITELRIAARARVEKQHTAAAMVNGMEALYYEVLGANTAPAS